MKIEQKKATRLLNATKKGSDASPPFAAFSSAAGSRGGHRGRRRFGHHLAHNRCVDVPALATQHGDLGLQRVDLTLLHHHQVLQVRPVRRRRDPRPARHPRQDLVLRHVQLLLQPVLLLPHVGQLLQQLRVHGDGRLLLLLQLLQRVHLRAHRAFPVRLFCAQAVLQLLRLPVDADVFEGLEVDALPELQQLHFVDFLLPVLHARLRTLLLPEQLAVRPLVLVVLAVQRLLVRLQLPDAVHQVVHPRVREDHKARLVERQLLLRRQRLHLRQLQHDRRLQLVQLLLLLRLEGLDLLLDLLQLRVRRLLTLRQRLVLLLQLVHRLLELADHLLLLEAAHAQGQDGLVRLRVAPVRTHVLLALVVGLVGVAVPVLVRRLLLLFFLLLLALLLRLPLHLLPEHLHQRLAHALRQPGQQAQHRVHVRLLHLQQLLDLHLLPVQPVLALVRPLRHLQLLCAVLLELLRQRLVLLLEVLEEDQLPVQQVDPHVGHAQVALEPDLLPPQLVERRVEGRHRLVDLSLQLRPLVQQLRAQHALLLLLQRRLRQPLELRLQLQVHPHLRRDRVRLPLLVVHAQRRAARHLDAVAVVDGRAAAAEACVVGLLLLVVAAEVAAEAALRLRVALRLAARLRALTLEVLQLRLGRRREAQLVRDLAVVHGVVLVRLVDAQLLVDQVDLPHVLVDRHDQTLLQVPQRQEALVEVQAQRLDALLQQRQLALLPLGGHPLRLLHHVVVVGLQTLVAHARLRTLDRSHVPRVLLLGRRPLRQQLVEQRLALHALPLALLGLLQLALHVRRLLLLLRRSDGAAAAAAADRPIEGLRGRGVGHEGA
eukprot:Rhum_TRINITY_DN23026_c0_g1::Rhum_TRINITY_DN23026_c0_g1_i1::g.176931::m.176931